MNVTTLGLDLIKRFEGLRLKAYRDTNGTWTIGYGTTAAADVGVDPTPGMTITREQADLYLALAARKFADQIGPAIKRAMTVGEEAALLSFAYNVGPGAFLGSSVLRKFNAGDKLGAANALLLWCKETKGGVKVVNQGLLTRRKIERAIFLGEAR
jgi:lysozyme